MSGPLYNLNEDPGEANDLSAKYPEKLAELQKKWDAEAIKYNVYPLYDDVAARVANIAKMSGAPKHLYVLPARRRVHQRGSLASGQEPQPHNHRVDGDRQQDRWHHRRRRRLLRRIHAVCEGHVVTYTYNAFDENYSTIKSSKPLTAGKHEVKFVYEAISAADKGQPAGKGTLFIDGAQMSQGTIGSTMPNLFSVSEPFDVGADSGGSVERKAYTAPFKFSDTLNSVRFDLK